MISRVLIEEPEDKPSGLVVFLTGRGVDLSDMYKFALHSGINHSIMMILEPQNYEWYPRPNGPQNQFEAVAGAKKSVDPIIKRIKAIAKLHEIPTKKIVVVGYSAGGVMALEIAQAIDFKMAMIMAIAGTVLDPNSVPPAKHNTPILIKISKNDEVFEWNERHVPAKESLLKNNYNLLVEEQSFGGHGITNQDCFFVKRHVDNVILNN